MTIGAAMLWWLFSLIGALILLVIITVIVAALTDDEDIGSAAGSCLGIIVGLGYKVAFWVIIVWYIYAMISQGLDPFEALKYKMW